MSMRKIAYLLLGASLSSSGPMLESARGDTFDFKKVTVDVAVPKGWYPVQGYFGSDLSIVGPEKSEGDSRTTLSFYDSELRPKSLGWKMALDTKSEYFDGRRAFVESNGGKYRKELVARNLPERDGFRGIELGFEYELDGTVFHEYSYYMTCGSEFLFAKGLYADKNGAGEESSLREFYASMKCREGGVLKAVPGLSRDQISKIAKSKTSLSATISAIRDFVVGLEGAPPNEDNTPADEEEKLELDSLYNFFKIAEAYAAPGAGSCLFGGWQSTYVKSATGNFVCQSPQPGAGDYKGCSGGKSFQCNPLLFGDGVCIGGSDRGMSQYATLRCNAERKPDAEINKYAAAYIGTHPGSLEDLVGTVDDLCLNSRYLASNTELCGTVISRLKSIASGEKQGNPVPEAEKAYQNHLAKKDIESAAEYEDAKKYAEKQARLFEKACMLDAGTYRTDSVPVTDETGAKGVVNCQTSKDALERNLGRIKRAEVKFDGSGNSNLEAICTPTQNKPLADKQIDPLNTAAYSMSCSQKKAPGTDGLAGCTRDINCAMAVAIPGLGSAQIALFNAIGGKSFTADRLGKDCSASRDSCMAQAGTAILKGLWSTLSGFWDLLGLGKDYVVSKVDQFWGWANGTKIEDDSSRRIQALSKKMNGEFAEFRKDIPGYLTKMVKGLLNGVTTWMTDDLFCTKWSGIPRTPGSKCEKPLPSLGCLDCKTMINGSCAAIGYVAEKVGESIAGSWAAGKAAGMTKGLAESTKTLLSDAYRGGKLEKMASGMLKKFPMIEKAGVATAKGAVKLKNGATWVVKAPFRVAGGIGKYLVAKPVGAVLKVLGDLKPVKYLTGAAAKKYAGSLAEKIVLTSKDAVGSIGELVEGAYKKGYASGLRTTNPAFAAAKSAGETATGFSVAANESRMIEGLADEYKLTDAQSLAVQKARALGTSELDGDALSAIRKQQEKLLRNAGVPKDVVADELNSKAPKYAYTAEQKKVLDDARKLAIAPDKKLSGDIIAEQDRIMQKAGIPADVRQNILKHGEVGAAPREPGRIVAGSEPGATGKPSVYENRTNSEYHSVVQDLDTPEKKKAYHAFERLYEKGTKAKGSIPTKVNELADKVHNTPTWVNGKLNPEKAKALAELRDELQKTVKVKLPLNKNGLSKQAQEDLMTKIKRQKIQAVLKDMKTTGVLGRDAATGIAEVPKYVIDTERNLVTKAAIKSEKPEGLFEEIIRSKTSGSDSRYYVKTVDGDIVVVSKVPDSALTDSAKSAAMRKADLLTDNGQYEVIGLDNKPYFISKDKLLDAQGNLQRFEKTKNMLTGPLEEARYRGIGQVGENGATWTGGAVMKTGPKPNQFISSGDRVRVYSAEAKSAGAAEYEFDRINSDGSVVLKTLDRNGDVITNYNSEHKLVAETIELRPEQVEKLKLVRHHEGHEDYIEHVKDYVVTKDSQDMFRGTNPWESKFDNRSEFKVGAKTEIPASDRDKINLNDVYKHADGTYVVSDEDFKKELLKIPGIGLKRAEAITKMRGQYENVYDLLRFNGISKKTYNQIKDHFTAGFVGSDTRAALLKDDLASKAWRSGKTSDRAANKLVAAQREEAIAPARPIKIDSNSIRGQTEKFADQKLAKLVSNGHITDWDKNLIGFTQDGFYKEASIMGYTADGKGVLVYNVDDKKIMTLGKNELNSARSMGSSYGAEKPPIYLTRQEVPPGSGHYVGIDLSDPANLPPAFKDLAKKYTWEKESIRDLDKRFSVTSRSTGKRLKREEVQDLATVPPPGVDQVEALKFRDWYATEGQAGQNLGAKVINIPYPGNPSKTTEAIILSTDETRISLWVKGIDGRDSMIRTYPRDPNGIFDQDGILRRATLSKDQTPAWLYHDSKKITEDMSRNLSVKGGKVVEHLQKIDQMPGTAKYADLSSLSKDQETLQAILVKKDAINLSDAERNHVSELSTKIVTEKIDAVETYAAKSSSTLTAYVQTFKANLKEWSEDVRRISAIPFNERSVADELALNKHLNDIAERNIKLGRVEEAIRLKAARGGR